MSGLHLPTFSGRRFIVSLCGSVLFSLLFLFLLADCQDPQDKVNHKFKQFEQHEQSAAEIQTQSSSQGRDHPFQLRSGQTLKGFKLTHAVFRRLCYRLDIQRIKIELDGGEVVLYFLPDGLPGIPRGVARGVALPDHGVGVLQVRGQELPVLVGRPHRG